MTQNRHKIDTKWTQKGTQNRHKIDNCQIQ